MNPAELEQRNKELIAELDVQRIERMKYEADCVTLQDAKTQLKEGYDVVVKKNKFLRDQLESARAKNTELIGIIETLRAKV